MTLGEYMAATGLDGGDGDDAAASMQRFVNASSPGTSKTRTARPIPATGGRHAGRPGLIRALQNAWIEAIIGVHDADPLPQSSPSGEPSLVESVPMEALSPSLAS
jgi:hypothetical protein